MGGVDAAAAFALARRCAAITAAASSSSSSSATGGATRRLALELRRSRLPAPPTFGRLASGSGASPCNVRVVTGSAGPGASSAAVHSAETGAPPPLTRAEEISGGDRGCSPVSSAAGSAKGAHAAGGSCIIPGATFSLSMHWYSERWRSAAARLLVGSARERSPHVTWGRSRSERHTKLCAKRVEF